MVKETTTAVPCTTTHCNPHALLLMDGEFLSPPSAARARNYHPRKQRWLRRRMMTRAWGALHASAVVIRLPLANRMDKIPAVVPHVTRHTTHVTRHTSLVARYTWCNAAGLVLQVSHSPAIEATGTVASGAASRQGAEGEGRGGGVRVRVRRKTCRNTMQTARRQQRVKQIPNVTISPELRGGVNWRIPIDIIAKNKY